MKNRPKKSRKCTFDCSAWLVYYMKRVSITSKLWICVTGISEKHNLCLKLARADMVLETNQLVGPWRQSLQISKTTLHVVNEI